MGWRDTNLEHASTASAFIQLHYSQYRLPQTVCRLRECQHGYLHSVLIHVIGGYREGTTQYMNNKQCSERLTLPGISGNDLHRLSAA